jgi:hypothetical protein
VRAGIPKANAGEARETSHIDAAQTTNTNGGGIFNSRARMTPPRHPAIELGSNIITESKRACSFLART